MRSTRSQQPAAARARRATGRRVPDAEQIASLTQALRELPEVDIVQLDTEWVSRFHAMLDVVRRIVLLAAGLFALGILVIVGNTIRLDIENRRDEIEVTKLVGGSNAFVRRPFLYNGVWYGLGGGLIAWLVVTVAVTPARGPRASGSRACTAAVSSSRAWTRSGPPRWWRGGSLWAGWGRSSRPPASCGASSRSDRLHSRGEIGLTRRCLKLVFH